MSGTIDLAIGAALLSHLLLAVLWVAGGSSRLSLVAALCFALALIGWSWRLGKPSLTLRRADLVFVPFGVLYLIHALAPPTAPDAIGYHLGLVSEWLHHTGLERAGAIGFYDAMPLGLETLFFGAASLFGLKAGAVVHLAFLLATVPLMVATAARFGFDGRPAALLYFAAPVVAVAGSAAYVDAALAFYSLATFWLLLDDRRPIAAGVTAGFCYAIKMSGGVVTLAACVYLLLARRSWKGVLAALAMVAPWLVRSWWLTGNPVAPMLADWFPSPAFHPEHVASWVEYVRSYDVPWRERWWEVTMGGARLQGLLGPGFLLAPAALVVFWRRRPAWLMVAAALVCGAAWPLNAGTRFLIPAALFTALALMSVLPARAGWAVALAQAILCWPSVLVHLAAPGAWVLPPVPPWRVVVGLENQRAFLGRTKPETQIAAMVARHVRPAHSGGPLPRVLDLGEAPRAYAAPVLLLSTWQHAAASRALAAMRLAHTAVYPALTASAAHWPRQRLRSLQIEQTGVVAADAWSLQEVRLLRQGLPVFPSRAWEFSASLNLWEAPLAFDRNPASGWQTHRPRAPGMFVRIEGSLDCDGLELLAPANAKAATLRITGVNERGEQVELAREMPKVSDTSFLPRLNLRRAATRQALREGFTAILAYRNDGSNERLGPALIAEATDWGLRIISETGGAVLLQIDPPSPASLP